MVAERCVTIHSVTIRAMAMSQEQLEELIKGFQNSMLTVVQSLTADRKQAPEQKEGTPEVVEKSPKLDLKNFTRVDKFAGGETAWKEWSFNLKVLVTSVNPSLERWFKIVETCPGNMSAEENLKQLYATEDLNPRDLEARSKELFGILCLLTEGEAKTMIRGQTDGIAAYQTLHRTYPRVTLAIPSA